jgi:hypothetical protein
MRSRLLAIAGWSTGFSNPRYSLLAAALFVVGAIERGIWNMLRGGRLGADGEAFSVATAIADGHGFANAYQSGQGATAHLLPVSPSIAGAVYFLFGKATLTSEIILASWSIGLALATFAVLARAFARLGTPESARLGALAFLCLLPTYFSQEAIDFRVWEGGLAAFLGALFLDRLLASTTQQELSLRTVVAMAALNALLFFVHPLLGAAAYASAAILCLRRLSISDFVRAAVIAVAMLALLLGPWTVRNLIALDHFVPLRSNAGMELAIGTDPKALDSLDRRKTFYARLSELHPRSSYAAYQRLQAEGGEVAYSAALGARAKRWITAHPGTETRLLLLHLRQIFFPETWMFRAFGSGVLAPLRAVAADAVGLLGLIGLAAALASRRRFLWQFPALMVGVPAVALCAFQPAVRYTYLAYPLLTYCMADAVGRVAIGRGGHDRAFAPAG